MKFELREGAEVVWQGKFEFGQQGFQEAAKEIRRKFVSLNGYSAEPDLSYWTLAIDDTLFFQPVWCAWHKNKFLKFITQSW